MTEVHPETVGRELVAAVGSRVMGWRVFSINDVRDDEWRDNPANYPYLEQYVGTALYTGACEFTLWNPDTDIVAAMMVAEKLRSGTPEMHIQIATAPDGWEVSIWKRFSTGEEVTPPLLAQIENHSLPLAICLAARAALAVVGNNEKT